MAVKKQVITSQMTAFFNFIRENGIVALAIGVVVGVAVKDTVDAFVNGIINPLLGLVLPNTETLNEANFSIGDSVFLWGAVVSSVIRLLTVAAVIYFVIKGLRLDKLDKKTD